MLIEFDDYEFDAVQARNIIAAQINYSQKRLTEWKSLLNENGAHRRPGEPTEVCPTRKKIYMDHASSTDVVF